MAVSIFGYGQPEPLLLNEVVGAAFALSLRKINANYFGYAVRVRRSSDNAETDIGFAGIAFDWASFSSFIGGGSGYVVTYYDQSGNGRNFTQSSASLQHQIVSTSALTTVANMSAASGTGGYLPSGYTMLNHGITYLGVFRATALYKGELFGANETPGYSFFSAFPDEGLFYHGNGLGPNSQISYTGGTYEHKRVLAAMRNADPDFLKSVYDRGTLSVGPSGYNFQQTTFTPRIGGSYSNFVGHWGEAIVYAKSLTPTEINKIQTNQMAYYGIS